MIDEQIAEDDKGQPVLPEYLDIPVFPLPNVTLFPNTTLPLHIFEPRYRALVENALHGDRLMGVALLRPGWQKNYFGSPPICKTFGVGKIVDYTELDDGKFNIVLEGLSRVRLIQEHATQPYRTAHVKVMQDPAIDAHRDQISEWMKKIHTITVELARQLPPVKTAILSALHGHPHPLVVVDRLSALMVMDAYDRQSILEQPDPFRRIRLLHVQLNAIAHQLENEDASSHPLLGEGE